MLRFIIPVVLLVSEATSYQIPDGLSAASPSQIKFAIENNYDNTGPGAKEPDSAYHTYKHLDDALVAYLDDPDTKLPPHDKARALERLYDLQRFRYGVDEHVKPINMYSGMVEKHIPTVLNKLIFDNFKRPFVSVVDLKNLHADDVDAVKSLDPYKWQKEQEPKKSPLTVNVYNKEEELKHGADYFLSFKQQPSDNMKLPPNGYYMYTDRNGKRRTVLYHTDNRPGFKSTIKQIFKK
ncbi:uncharacterized protein LOC113240451 [Hyposmocoma kahamanoa]|uniref:uncharacterized protein LOC113240451 n=1 Tax=Hyposmocoma kahamanoa TaxID=1477025 RepID=UPI000E6D876C|nr:uncharacterized protein LOC113240451 [Hyposmocoma kahamanoa]